MKKILLSLMILIFTIRIGYSEYIMKWTNTYNGGDNDNHYGGVVVDSDGNVYITGVIAFAGNYAYCTIKYSSLGSALWTNIFDNGSWDRPGGVAVDSDNNVYVTGGSIIGAQDDYCTIKYSSSGVAIWTNYYNGGAGNDVAYGIAVDSDDNIYVTGFSVIGGNMDYCTIKYDSSGSALWTNFYDDSGNDTAYGVAVDKDGNVFVTGESSIGGNDNYCTIKYSSSGVALWTNIYDSGDDDTAYGVAVDTDGNVYVTGESRFSVSFDYYTIKYNSSGSTLWINTYDSGSGYHDTAYGVAVDTDNNIYVTGLSGDGGNEDYCTIKYSSSGSALWTNVYDSGNDDNGYGVAVATNFNPNRIFVTGSKDNGSNNDFFTYGIPPQKKPINFSGTAISSTSIVWTWSDQSDDELGFQIQDPRNIIIGNIGVNVTSWTETGLSLNTTYTRHCVATNELGKSYDSNQYIVTTLSGPYYVATNGSDTLNDGSFLHPFRTIQKAVNAMSPGVTSATCYVFPGIYSETIEINSNKNSGYIMITKLSNEMPLLTGSLSSNIGIFITNADNIMINNLSICKFSNGVFITGDATNNKFINNNIYSNKYSGVYINSDQADYNDILTNKIWGLNQNNGIKINNSDNINIYYNLIYNNEGNNLSLSGNAVNIRIINNTVYGSKTNNGVFWNNTSSGEMFNNIILSNGNGVGDYGIQNSGIGIVKVAFNNIYGNTGGPTNGNLTYGNGNIYSNPLLETVSSFIIASSLSPAIDSGTNIFYSTGTDMGWKEYFPIGGGNLSKPVITKVTVVSFNTINLKWNDLSNETSYTLFRNLENNINTALKVNGFSADQINYNDIGLQSRTIYYYWLRAYNSDSVSEFSDVVSTKTISTFESDLSNFIIGPSPYKPYDGKHSTGTVDSGIIFDRLTKDAIIEVYTIHGQLIAKLEETDADGKLIWIVPDKIASGVYLCRIINSQNEKKIRKIMIIK